MQKILPPITEANGDLQQSIPALLLQNPTVKAFFFPLNRAPPMERAV